MGADITTQAGAAQGVSKKEFFIKWDSVNHCTPSDKVAFSGAVLTLTHDLGTGYITQSILDIQDAFGNSGVNTYGDVNYDSDSYFTYIDDNTVTLTFASEPNLFRAFKITLMG